MRDVLRKPFLISLSYHEYFKLCAVTVTAPNAGGLLRNTINLQNRY